MKLKRFILFALLVCVSISVLVLSGCAKATASFNRDGSGTCTITVSKDGGPSKAELEQKIDEIIKGVKLKSQKDRLSLTSLTESEDGYVIKMSFKQISDTKGLGNFSFETGTSFGGQIVQRNLMASLEKGTVSSKNLSNYDDTTYTVLDKVAVKPVSTTGEEVASSDFKNSGNSFYTDENIFFTYTICGFDNVQSITFEFPGEILIYGDLNATVEGDKITVTPVSVNAKKIGIKDGVPFTEEGDCSLFVGYVVFRLKTDYAPIIVGGIMAVIAIGLIVAGILLGWFKRFFKSKTFAKILRHKVLYLFMLPGIVIFAIFNYAPMVGIIVAFKNHTIDGGIFGSEWANSFGFEHFITLFTHPGSEFGMILRNTVVMALLKFVTGFPAAIILALMFNALHNGIFKKSVQTISYLPYFVSWVVVSNIVYLFLSANGGIVNNLLESMGVDKIRFYSEPKYWWGIISITSLWKSVGWGTIVYLAAITAINPDLYEAASIDGAGPWRKLWTVTIPGMMPVIGIQLILNAGNLIKDDFDQIFSLVGSSNYELREVTEVFSSLVYRNLQGGPKGFSASTAISLVQSIMSLGLVLGADAIVRKTDNPGLW